MYLSMLLGSEPCAHMAQNVTYCRKLLHACCWPLRRGSGESGLELQNTFKGVGAGQRGPEIVVNGNSVKGSGRCYADTVMEQDRVYFEVHIVDADANSSCSVGCGKLPVTEDLAKQLGTTFQSFGAKFGLGGQAPLQVGDILGCGYDQDSSPVKMTIWHNGVELPNATLKGMKGEQWPALSLEGCAVNWVFRKAGFKYYSVVPKRFEELLASANLIDEEI